MTTPPPTAPSVPALIATYARPEIGRIVLLAVTLLAGVALGLAAPLVVRRFIDAVSTPRHAAPLGVLWGLAGLFLAATLAAQAARLAAAYLAQRIGWAATNRLRRDLAAHALALDMGFHHAHPPGEMIERVDGDVGELAGVFSQFVLQIAGAGLTWPAYRLVFAEDWRVGALIGALALVAFAALVATRNLSTAGGGGRAGRALRAGRLPGGAHRRARRHPRQRRRRPRDAAASARSPACWPPATCGPG